jgi:MSHA pilin protein MshA
MWSFNQREWNMKKNRGFTLIELVAVMVILAVLAVVAIPQFVDLRNDARIAAATGVAGALSSAATLNFARRSANAANGTAVDDCQDVGTLLVGGVLPSEGTLGAYTITAGVVPTVPAGQTVACTLNHPDGTTTATFTAVGIP